MTVRHKISPNWISDIQQSVHGRLSAADDNSYDNNIENWNRTQQLIQQSINAGYVFNSNNVNGVIPVPVIPEGSYLYYRWQITQLRGAVSLVQASEFVFRIDGVDQIATTGGAAVYNPVGSSPSGEEPNKLIDNDINTKWLDFNFTPNGSVSNFVFQFSVAQEFNGYRWATANDEIDRDPISWNVAGSNDGTTWTTLHTVSGFSTTTDRLTYQTAQTY